MKKYITTIIVLLSINYTFAQVKLDSLQILKDVNGGNVVFTPIAANAVTFGNGYGTNNMAFITALRNYTNSTLPITLVSLKSKREANTIQLTWRTSSEKNSNYFEILKSSDGKKFSSIGVVKAAGNSSQELTYYFKDLTPTKGNNYYQLNMVDLDGTAEKSIIVASVFDFEKVDFNVKTNASNGTLAVSAFSNKVQKADFEVYDLLGNKLLERKLILENGLNNFDFKLNTNAKMIIIQLNCDGDKQVKKLFY